MAQTTRAERDIPLRSDTSLSQRSSSGEIFAVTVSGLIVFLGSIVSAADESKRRPDAAAALVAAPASARTSGLSRAGASARISSALKRKSRGPILKYGNSLRVTRL